MHVGIDCDVILYQCAFSVQSRGYIGYDKDDNPISFSWLKKDIGDVYSFRPYSAVDIEDIDSCRRRYLSKVSSIIRRTGAKSHTLYLTGKGNFRHDLYEHYKEGRPPKPLLYSILRDFIESSKHTVVVDGQEADDALSIAQYKDPENHIIATIDKDLLMVPGSHYNFNTDEFVVVGDWEGLKTFYKQILTGDSVDNIPGIKGIGPKRAQNILVDCHTEEKMWKVVVGKWASVLQHDSVEETVVNFARLLWMRSKEGELWNPPV